MFITIAIAVTLGFLVIFAMKRVPAPLSQEQRDAGFGDGQGVLPFTLAIERFETLCRRLLQASGLDILHMTTTGHQLEAMAVNPAPLVGGLYVVHGRLLHDTQVVEVVDVLALLDEVKGEGASKGVLLTNGFFSDEAAKAATMGPVELINGMRLGELLQHFDILPMPREEFHPDINSQSRS